MQRCSGDSLWAEPQAPVSGLVPAPFSGSASANTRLSLSSLSRVFSELPRQTEHFPNLLDVICICPRLILMWFQVFLTVFFPLVACIFVYFELLLLTLICAALDLIWYGAMDNIWKGAGPPTKNLGGDWTNHLSVTFHADQ